MAKAKVATVMKTKKTATKLATSNPEVVSDYDKDPDKGERPYKDYEVEDMAKHAMKGMEVMTHPRKRKAVLGHFAKQKDSIKNFEDLHDKVSQEMDT